MNPTKKQTGSRRIIAAKQPDAVTFVELKKRAGSNLIVVDTNVLIQAPDKALPSFLRGGNCVVIPWQVIQELDKLKNTEKVGHEAQQAIKKIHSLLKTGKKNVVIEQRVKFNSNLDKTKGDHMILATVNFILSIRKNPQSLYYNYGKIKLVTNDYAMQIQAQKMGENSDLIVEFYKQDMANLRASDLLLPKITIPSKKQLIFDEACRKLYYPLTKKCKIEQNGAVLIRIADMEKPKEPKYVAIRKGDRLMICDENISVAGIKARSKKGINWEQIVALHHLVDEDVRCVVLQGASGSGKTLFALAAAMQARKRKFYPQIFICRPMSEIENMGYMPGDENKKVAPWYTPIFQSYAVIKDHEEQVVYKKKKEIRSRKTGKIKIPTQPEKSTSHVKVVVGVEGIKLLNDNDIYVQPLGFMRGASFRDCFFIIDEAQNLTRAQVKMVTTRIADGAKIVFTGDINQIDLRQLTRESSGLTNLVVKMKQCPIAAVVNLKETLRSPLAAYAEKNL